MDKRVYAEDGKTDSTYDAAPRNARVVYSVASYASDNDSSSSIEVMRRTRLRRQAALRAISSDTSSAEDNMPIHIKAKMLKLKRAEERKQEDKKEAEPKKFSNIPKCISSDSSE